MHYMYPYTYAPTHPRIMCDEIINICNVYDLQNSKISYTSVLNALCIVCVYIFSARGVGAVSGTGKFIPECEF